jgi:hypothetical protein
LLNVNYKGIELMDNSVPPQPQPLPAVRELRERIPQLHPVVALNLTIEPMLLRGEVTSEEYLKLASVLVAASGKWLFGHN